MAKPILYLPKPVTLECDANGKLTIKNMEEYFKTLGTIPSQLKTQIPKLGYGECSNDLINAVILIEKVIDEVTGILMTDVFKKIKSKEQEMEYKVREFIKEIDVWFQKKIVEILVKIVSIIAAPIVNVLNMPLPFLSSIDLIDETTGQVTKYRPRVLDFFTKQGKVRIKLAMAETIEDVEKFFKTIDEEVTELFAGEWNIKSPEHQSEELWQKALDWINKVLNDFMIAAINALVKFLEKIPIIGQLIKALGPLIDPTKPLEQQFKDLWKRFKEKYKKERDDFLSGKTLENLASKILDDFIDTILNFPIPIFGTLGKLLGINVKKEERKYKIQMKEKLLARIKDGWNNAMEKIRRFFAGGWIKMINDILLKLPGWILKRFPIVGKIFKLIQTIVDVCTGKIPVCQVVKTILSPIFDLFKIVLNFLPLECFEIVYTEYGLVPLEYRDAPPVKDGPSEEVSAGEGVGKIVAEKAPAPVEGTTKTKDGNVIEYEDRNVKLTNFGYAKDGTLNSYVEQDKTTGKTELNTFVYGPYQADDIDSRPSGNAEWDSLPTPTTTVVDTIKTSWPPTA